MTICRTFAVFILLLLSTLSFAQNRDAGVLMQADRDFAKATAEKGAEGWVSYMAPGAVLLGSKPVVGPEEIKTAMTSMFASGVSLKWEPTQAELVGSAGDLGYTIGRFERRSPGKDGNSTVQKGTYMTTWQKQKDGTWKVIGDIGSADPSH